VLQLSINYILLILINYHFFQKLKLGGGKIETNFELKITYLVSYDKFSLQPKAFIKSNHLSIILTNLDLCKFIVDGGKA
jgi:hypothetical protein